jgi:hypothetical protein
MGEAKRRNTSGKVARFTSPSLALQAPFRRPSDAAENPSDAIQTGCSHTLPIPLCASEGRVRV